MRAASAASLTAEAGAGTGDTFRVQGTSKFSSVMELGWWFVLRVSAFRSASLCQRLLDGL